MNNFLSMRLIKSYTTGSEMDSNNKYFFFRNSWQTVVPFNRINKFNDTYNKFEEDSECF